MTDAELVRRARAGDRDALEQLVRRYSPRLLAVCRARIGRDQAAEDLAQESLLRGITHISALEHPEKLGAWLRGIAVRVCMDWLRACRRRQVSLSSLTGADSTMRELDVADASPPQTDGLEQQERRQHLLRAIDELPEELREPLLLFYYDDVTYEQIAGILGVSRATVNARLAKARAKLSRQLAHLMR